MIAYRTGEVFDKGHMIGKIKMRSGKRSPSWAFYPRFATGTLSPSPTIESSSRADIENKLGCVWHKKETR
jgi:hypothetical protein